jgi:3-phosphoshikimate 1-carboxyvinyltransferase
MLPAIVFFLAQYPYFFEFTNLESIRFKETDRVAVLYENLINMGIKVSMTKDTLSFTGSNNLNNLIIDAHNDHRIIMGASLLGIKKGKKITIKNIKNIDSSYPNYFTDLEKLGAKIKMFHEEH